ncbi:alpha/beta fold hydrolase [Kribbella sp. NPDC050124]|uniref:alpha/beta fold hydrolase n=1 Tax=Kribbella sp. NPDC050124 TaxID=3364114 RepID=UPI00379F3EB0
MLPTLDGVTHTYVELPGLRMHVTEAGSGDAVLMLHGFTQHWWEWRDVIPTMAQHYRVICPDLRGAGWTDAPPDGYTADQLLGDLLALLDALDLDQVHLIAHDWSAIVAYLLCLEHPDRVRDQVSIAIPPPYIDFDGAMVRSLLRHAWFNFILPVPGLGPWALRTWLTRYLLASVSHGISDEDLEIFTERLREPARARAGSALYRHFIQPVGTRMLRGKYKDQRLTTRTLVLLGAEDPNVRAEFLHGYEPYVDDLRIHEVAGASHFVVDDKPDEVTRLALEFFKG